MAFGWATKEWNLTNGERQACPGGGIGRRKGLKIPRHIVLYRFDSGSGHQLNQGVRAFSLAP